MLIPLRLQKLQRYTRGRSETEWELYASIHFVSALPLPWPYPTKIGSQNRFLGKSLTSPKPPKRISNLTTQRTQNRYDIKFNMKFLVHHP
jgi:hypothetical protein